MNKLLQQTIMVASTLLAPSVDSLSTNHARKPLAGVLFDIDGTLIHSDPIHQRVFREMLLKEEGFNDNQPIDEAFFRANIAGRQNALIMADFFPSWSLSKREQWSIDKEASFREMAASEMMSLKMKGLDKLKQWIEERNLPRAAVTNAPRLNAEAMINGIEYTTFFQTLVIGDECERAKPDPCPYLTACKNLNISSSEGSRAAENCVVFEDSPSGARAGVAAGATVIGVLSGQEESTLMGAGCLFVIKNFEDVKLWDYLETRV